MNSNKSLKITILMITLLFSGLLLILIGSSYAFIDAITEQQNPNVIKVGTLELSYEDGDKKLVLDKVLPVTDDEGLTSEGYTFTITNTGTLPTSYTIQILNDEDAIAADGCLEKLLPLYDIRVSVDNLTPFNLSDIESNNNVIDNNILAPGASKTHTVKMWLSEESGNEILGKHYHGKVAINGTQSYIDDSNANTPELTEGLIPVIYDKANNSWVKADTTAEWFDYDDQSWANAVTVTEANRQTYNAAPAGTAIPMDDINTMWVWIPRYEYRYDNLGTDYAGGTATEPGEIEVNFVSKATTTPSDEATYKVHPAFTFGDKELSGLWYAKFELSTLESCRANSTINSGCDLTTLTPQLKPNVTSWRGARVATFYTASRNMQLVNNNIYGFNSTSSMDIHMSKNSEWGSVAYLSQSKYGKYGNDFYIGADKEVAINNCDSYITGVGGDTVSAAESSSSCTTNTYETTLGQAASTTGNITGIYDMSGGSYEYVIGVLADEEGLPRSGEDSTRNSGFNGTLSDGTQYTDGIDFPDSKYYDLYTTDGTTTACAGGKCFGQALSETRLWYSDYADFVYNDDPWLLRSGYFSSSRAGVFYYNFANGRMNGSFSSRPAIAP